MSASDAELLDALPVGRLATPSRPVTRVPKEWTEVLDLVAREVVRLRRGQCGLGSCCCSLVVWSSDEAAPKPDPYDWACLYDETLPCVCDKVGIPEGARCGDPWEDVG